MGLVSLKYEFRCLTGLDSTASNARYYLSSINYPTYGYDFRTIKSWSELVETIEQYLASIQEEVIEEPDAELSEVEEQILETYSTLTLTWQIVKRVERIFNLKAFKKAKRRISLWLHPDLNKDRLATKYMSIFNDIFDQIKLTFIRE